MHRLTSTYDSAQVVTQLSYDALGREAERRFEQNGTLLQVMTSTYHANGMLATRVLRDAGSRVVIGETFTYDAYLRLKTYRCEGQEHPEDHLGRGIVGQDFSFDGLNNITRVITTFADGTHDTCERYFTGVDPTQLTRLTHTLPAQDVTLTYDAAGNLQVGPGGQAYTYNELDQLTGVRLDTHEYRYEYDADSRQVLAARNAEPKVMLGYANDRLEILDEGEKQVRYFDGEDKVFARAGGVDGPQLYANDASGSVRGVSAPGQAHTRRHYTPYGHAPVIEDDGKLRTLADLQQPALNGQRLDAATGLYFMGNGLRAYCPDLMIFLQRDSLSPFDEGGINGYAYCAGNPINMADPTGLWPSWLNWVVSAVLLAISVVTLGYAAPAVATAYAAFTAAAAAAKAAAAAALVGKTIGLASATAGFISQILGAAGQGIAQVDKKMGWDRSHHAQNLGTASFIFGIAAWTGNGVNAVRTASATYISASRAGAGVFSASVTAARESAKGITGYGYSFGARDPNIYSRAFGVTRFAIGATAFGRAIESRINPAAPGSSTETAQPRSFGADSAAPASAQPQFQPTASYFTDMPGSSADYYQAFRDEAWRIRQPILPEVIQGRGEA